MIGMGSRTVLVDAIIKGPEDNLDALNIAAHNLGFTIKQLAQTYTEGENDHLH